MIFLMDHEPPHVHAFGPDFRVKLAIADARVLEGRGTIGPVVLRRLQGWVAGQRGRLWIDAAIGNPIGKLEE